MDLLIKTLIQFIPKSFTKYLSKFWVLRGVIRIVKGNLLSPFFKFYFIVIKSERGLEEDMMMRVKLLPLTNLCKLRFGHFKVRDEEVIGGGVLK